MCSARLQAERAPADARNDVAVAVRIARTVRQHQLAVALQCPRHIQILRTEQILCVSPTWQINCLDTGTLN